MAMSYFGSTLTDLQRGQSASEAEAAATQRAKIASDAQRMGNYFNLIANRQRTEQDQQRLEADRAARYFDVNQRGDQFNRELEMRRDQFNREMDFNARELDMRGDQFTRELDLEREALSAGTPQSQQSDIQAVAAANQANLALAALTDEANNKKTEFYKYWTFGQADETQAQQQVEAFIRKGLAEIPARIGRGADLIQYDPVSKRFVPIRTPSPSRVPIPGQESALPGTSPNGISVTLPARSGMVVEPNTLPVRPGPPIPADLPFSTPLAPTPNRYGHPGAAPFIPGGTASPSIPAILPTSPATGSLSFPESDLINRMTDRDRATPAAEPKRYQSEQEARADGARAGDVIQVWDPRTGQFRYARLRD